MHWNTGLQRISRSLVADALFLALYLISSMFYLLSAPSRAFSRDRKTRVRSLKCSCTCASAKSRTHVGSRCDSQEKGGGIDHCKAVRQQRMYIGRPSQRIDCSINMCSMLEDSSLFDAAFEIPSLCCGRARRPEAPHDVREFHRTIRTTSCQHLFFVCSHTNSFADGVNRL